MSSNIRVQKICEICGNDFTARTTVTRFCSHKCSSKAYKLRLKNNKINKVINKTNQQKILSLTELNHEAIKTKDFLSIKEAYTLIGVSERTFYRILKAGTIRFAKIGSRTIIKRTEIDKLFTL